jgi:hypothetical protein
MLDSGKFVLRRALLPGSELIRRHAGFRAKEAGEVIRVVEAYFPGDFAVGFRGVGQQSFRLEQTAVLNDFFRRFPKESGDAHGQGFRCQTEFLSIEFNIVMFCVARMHQIEKVMKDQVFIGGRDRGRRIAKK